MPSARDVYDAPHPHSAPPAQVHASPAALLAQADPAAAPAGQQALRLAEASRALWIATLSLMTAFMQTAAPAHKYLLARRIARNLDTLSRQDCFESGCRASFVRLAQRWQARSEQFAPQNPRPAGRMLRLFF